MNSQQQNSNPQQKDKDSQLGGKDTQQPKEQPGKTYQGNQQQLETQNAKDSKDCGTGACNTSGKPDVNKQHQGQQAQQPSISPSHKPADKSAQGE